MSTMSMSGCGSVFNAQLYVSEQLNRQLLNTTQDVAIRCVNVLAEKFNFDADEAIQMLGLNLIKLERKMPEKVVKAKAVKVAAAKSAFPLPYNGEFNDSCCYALRQNNGLYTQCTGIRKGDNSYCKGCASQMQKVGAEMPEYGTIQQRMAVGIFEYVDPKGRKPISYTKIMKKYKINEAEVLAEAEKFNVKMNAEHFVVPEEGVKRGRPKAEKAPKEKGAKGRPKKSKKVLQIEGEDEDLFSTLVAQANANEEIVGSHNGVALGKKGKTDEEKEAERLQKEAEKQAKKEAAEKAKAEKEAKLAAEKAEKEAKLAAEKEARAAKKAAEEAEKQAKKEALEKAKAEKEAKLAAEKAEKEAKKSAKKPEGKAKAAAPSEEEEPDDEPDVVKKIEFEGKKYLKSKKTGIIYDYNMYVKNQEQVVVGKWSDSANKIIFDDGEESEEEYDM